MMTRISALILTALVLSACSGVSSGDDSFKFRKSGVSSEKTAGR